jgi:hypothetical protein
MGSRQHFAAAPFSRFLTNCLKPERRFLMSHKLNRKTLIFSMIALSCFTLILFSAISPGSHALDFSAENLVLGGSACASFMDGVAVGAGIATLFGCFWCAGVAIGAKAVGLFC